MAQGLYNKYNVTKANGDPTDPNAEYFVLRIDTDPAARAALEAYAKAQPDLSFREELIRWIETFEGVTRRVEAGIEIERCEKCNYPSSNDTQCINCGTCLVCAWDGSPGTEDMCPRCDRRREYWVK